MRTALLTVAVTLLAAAASAADEKQTLVSGPAPGSPIPGPFQPYVVVGKAKFKDRFHCPVTEYGLNPVVGVFVRGAKATDPVVKLVAELDKLAVENDASRLGVFVAFLAPDIKLDDKEMDKVKAAVEKVRQEDNTREEAKPDLEDRFKELKQTTVVFDWLGNVKPLYKLNDAATVTVVVYNQNKVLSTHAFPGDAETAAGVAKVVEDVKAQLATIKAELAGRPKN